MFSRIGGRLTYANVAMTLALVFAMSGGAFAASKYLITSTKQIKPSVLKQLKGKIGPAGKEGPTGKEGAKGANGTNGANGEKGAAGTNGNTGANGKSVVAGVEAKGTNCKEGGSNFEVEGSTIKHYACNGEKGATGAPGSPWTGGGTLPSGATETGSWGAGSSGFELALISFPIPLAAKLDNAAECDESGEPACVVVYVTAAEQTGGTAPTQCSGSAEAPTATSGTFCVYEAAAAGISSKPSVASSGNGSTANGHAATAGAVLVISGSGYIYGTWAVTG
jgi:collagen type VII alpha